MRLDLETEIRYPNGERAGILRRVAVNNDGEAVSVVMATTDLISRNVIVPVHLLSDGPGGVLTINTERNELSDLPDFQEEAVPVIPGGWEFSDEVAPGGDVFPATLYEPIIPRMEENNLGEDDLVLSQGTEVVCLDGRWGVVDEVLTDDNDQVRAFVGRADDTLQHDRIIPLTLVLESSPNEVTLNCTLADLSTYTEELVNELEEPEVE
jgi:hypothetical protein